MQALFSPTPTVALSYPAGLGVPKYRVSSTVGLRELVTAGGGQDPSLGSQSPTPKPLPPLPWSRPSAHHPGLGSFRHSARALSIVQERALCQPWPAVPLRCPPGLVSGSASQSPLLLVGLRQGLKTGKQQFNTVEHVSLLRNTSGPLLDHSRSLGSG